VECLTARRLRSDPKQTGNHYAWAGKNRRKEKRPWVALRSVAKATR